VVGIGDLTYATPSGPDTAPDMVPHGPSHITPIAMQQSEATARGGARNHTMAMSTARNGRNQLIDGECSTRRATYWMNP
jgi:hypothetical protein